MLLLIFFVLCFHFILILQRTVYNGLCVLFCFQLAMRGLDCPEPPVDFHSQHAAGEDGAKQYESIFLPSKQEAFIKSGISIYTNGICNKIISRKILGAVEIIVIRARGVRQEFAKGDWTWKERLASSMCRQYNLSTPPPSSFHGAHKKMFDFTILSPGNGTRVYTLHVLSDQFGSKD